MDISIDASEVVRDFYERHPYPRPVEDLDKYKVRWQDTDKRRADYHLFFPDRPFREDQSILIAGCGTSQAAKHAIRWPDANISAIDFSEKSISSTEKLKEKYKLNNLSIFQLPIENVKELGINFDQIVCTGVLHHLPDPDAGLSALSEVLKPEGAMHLMVYAPYGRTGIYMIQDFCRMLGITASEEGIRDLIKALLAIPPGHPLENLLRNAPDFKEEAALADALLNPQDRAYSVPQLFEFINKGRLKFGRWIRQAPYSPHCGAVAQIPQAKTMEQMSREKMYASVELFRGTMIRHSFIAYRNDNPVDPELFNDHNTNRMSYVPIRIPDTLCIEEHLPEGAAAVLLNRTHTFRDLILPINSIEKKIYDGIDGAESIESIAGKVFSSTDIRSGLEIAHALFEKLWWYDQVVFDTSHSNV